MVVNLKLETYALRSAAEFLESNRVSILKRFFSFIARKTGLALRLECLVSGVKSFIVLNSSACYKIKKSLNKIITNLNHINF